MRESNEVLFKIKCSHEQLTSTLKETEMKLWEEKENSLKQFKVFDSERLEFKTQKMEQENI